MYYSLSYYLCTCLYAWGGGSYVQLYSYALCTINILSTRALLMWYVTECTIYIGYCNAYILVYYLRLGDIKLNAGVV
jgi:hypothetical protein